MNIFSANGGNHGLATLSKPVFSNIDLASSTTISNSVGTVLTSFVFDNPLKSLLIGLY